MTILSLPLSSTICPIITAIWENLRPLSGTLNKLKIFGANYWRTTGTPSKSLFDLGLALKANGKFTEAKDFLEQCKTTMQEKVVNDKTLEEK